MNWIWTTPRGDSQRGRGFHGFQLPPRGGNPRGGFTGGYFRGRSPFGSFRGNTRGGNFRGVPPHERPPPLVSLSPFPLSANRPPSSTGHTITVCPVYNIHTNK